MGWSIDEVQKTKVGSTPENRAAIASAFTPVAGHSDPQLQQNKVPALVCKGEDGETNKSRLEPCVITIIRFGAKELDDDNWSSVCKTLRDSIARTLRVDDADKRLIWQYRQVVGLGIRGTLVKIL